MENIPGIVVPQFKQKIREMKMLRCSFQDISALQSHCQTLESLQIECASKEGAEAVRSGLKLLQGQFILKELSLVNCLIVNLVILERFPMLQVLKLIGNPFRTMTKISACSKV